MSIKSTFKKWLITKLAGDSLVILNATMLYKHYPIFADIEQNPIIENNQIIKIGIETPFLIYGNSIFELIDNELVVKEQYKASYTKALDDIVKASEVSE